MISGSGNVAQFTAKKLLALGAGARPPHGSLPASPARLASSLPPLPSVPRALCTSSGSQPSPSPSAVPLTFSDSSGTVYEPDGFDAEKLECLIAIKARSPHTRAARRSSSRRRAAAAPTASPHPRSLPAPTLPPTRPRRALPAPPQEARGARVSEYAEHSATAIYMAGEKPWAVAADLAFPSATQNELDAESAAALVANGACGVFEGANMPCTPEAVAVFEEHKTIFGPAKAANAGGVAVSGLEMAQNSQRESWDADTVDAELQRIMSSIHAQCHAAAAEYGWGTNLKAGANIAGFKRVADALWDQGAV